MAKVSPAIVDVDLMVGTVRAGDTLVVAKHGPMTRAEANSIKEHLEAKLPGVNVLPIEADGLVVYRKS